MGEITLKDVAQRAGVSTAAASQALNDRGSLRPDTRARIKEIAAELGYAPHAYAAALRRGRTMSIGYVVPDRHERDAESRWAIGYARQLTSLVRAAAGRGFTVTVIPPDRPDLVRGARLDAVYAADPRPTDPVLCEAARLGIAVVANDLPLPARAASRSAPATRTRPVRASTCSRARGRRGWACSPRTADARATRPARMRTSTGAPARARSARGPRGWRARRPRRRRARPHGGGDGRRLLLPREGPEVYVRLERTRRVIPRDLQLVALCVHDCALNERLGITRTCVHPEEAPGLVIDTLADLLASGAPSRAEVSLPWELLSGSTTRL